MRRDRESDQSIVFFSVQLFTTPSVASWLVEEMGMFERTLDIIEAYLLHDKRPLRNLVIDGDEYDQESYENNQTTRCDSHPFRNGRYVHLLQDLRYLMQLDYKGDALSKHYSLATGRYARLLRRFNAMDPNWRVVGQHVEYESEAWYNAFNLAFVLGKSTDGMARALAVGGEQVLTGALRLVLTELLLPLDRVNIDSLQNDIRLLLVSEGPVSFHHPLHWLAGQLFTQLCRTVGLPEAIKTFNSCLDAIINTIAADSPMESDAGPTGRRRDVAHLLLIDPPLRVWILLAQIRSGMWVRNGYSIRNQVRSLPLFNKRVFHCGEYEYY